MKKTLLVLIIMAALTAIVKGETKYTVIMSGVTWGGCKVDVSSALIKTFKATKVTIEKGEDRKQVVKFTSDNNKITRRALDKAINNKKKYIVWKIRGERKVPDLPNQWPDGTWHLLLIEKGGPWIKA